MSPSFTEHQRLAPWLSAVNRGAAMLIVGSAWVSISLLFASETRPAPWLWALIATIGIAVGMILPLMLWSLQLRIRLDKRRYTVRIWPTPFKSQIARREVKDAYVREVDPMRDYGGWGLKGKRRDLLYSVGGKQAVTVEYRRKGQTRKLTVTTERADELLGALSP